MPTIPFHNAGSIGIIKDLPPHELPPEAWSEGANIRFDENSAEKFLGHSNIFGTPTVAPYWLLSVQSAGVKYWIYGGLTKLYVTDGTTHKSITQVGDYSATEAIGWTGGVLGGIPILNNGVDNPQQWDLNFSTPSLCTDLSNWPASTTAKVLRVFKSTLIALGVTESGTLQDHMVKWSEPADVGGVPSSWDPADATKLAGEKDLSETNGILVDCVPLRDINVIYKEDSIWGMQEVQGVFVYRFFKSLESSGALSRRCVQSFGGRHIAMGFDDIVMHDLQTSESLVQNRLRRWFFAQLDADNFKLSFIARHDSRGEIWFCIPTSGAARPNLALVWNVRNNTFGVRDLPSIAHLAWGSVDASPNDTWDADTGVWDLDISVWDSNVLGPDSRGFLGAAPSTTELFRFDDTNTFDGATFTSSVERTGLAIVGKDRSGAPRADFDLMKIITGVRPRIESSGAINVYVGSQEYRDSEVVWSTAFSFDPNTDFKIDCAVSGRLMAIRFESTTDISWKLYGYDLEIEIMGRF